MAAFGMSEVPGIGVPPAAARARTGPGAGWAVRNPGGWAGLNQESGRKYKRP